MLPLREGEETVPRGCMARAPRDFAAVRSTLAAAVSALWGQRAGNPQSSKYTSLLQKYVHTTPDTTRLHKGPPHPSRHQQTLPRHGTILKLACATHRPCWVPAVFLRPGVVCQPSWQHACGSDGQLLLPALCALVSRSAAPRIDTGSEEAPGAFPVPAHTVRASPPGREADARPPRGGRCVQPLSSCHKFFH